MDALSRRTIEAPRGIDALPPDAPLAMPQQSLWQRRGRAPSPRTAPRSVWFRRLLVFGAAIALTAIAAYEMYEVLQVGGLTVLETVVLVLFVALFAWIALSFISALCGFVVSLAGAGRTLGIDPTAPLPALAGRTALLLPTYNEDPHRVTARLQAIYESVGDTGRLAHFDFFILSDTTDPAIWLAEEVAFLRLRGEFGTERLYYRHRTKNIARKAGNIGEWVRRFGGAYDHMIVLDADSLMEGDTVVRLAAAMESRPNIGLIQTLPQLVNGNTLFARLQQFAGRVYGPLIARGIAWWHGAESNYWGHNAIIRVAAFAEQAGLPLLRGNKPFGGHILSHDFIEAALMRRAGWAVHMVPELGGSYEECPPTLTDYAVRDRRWCQGNLQHIAVLPARGLHWVSRLHLMQGIGSYITAPMWLLFLFVGILISLQSEFIPPDYFPRGATLFPQWPMQDPVRAAYVFGGTMALLVLPKLLGWMVMMVHRRDRRGIGGMVRGLVSVVIEVLISALIAPVMMLMQSRAVMEIVAGRDAGWAAQRRDDGGFAPGEFARAYAFPTMLGAALGAGAYAVSAPLLLWMSPVVVGLLLAIPIAAVTARASVGRALRAAGLLLTPEEREPPAILTRANELASAPPPERGERPLLRLLGDRALRAVHERMLGDAQPRARGEVDVHLAVALMRIDDAADREEAVAMLSPREAFAVMANRDALRRLAAKPEIATAGGVTRAG
ncbi:MAG TPA: glucans biosynthesis glucosyltransferase MdoH [Pseudolabrys sp.]